MNKLTFKKLKLVGLGICSILSLKLVYITANNIVNYIIIMNPTTIKEGTVFVCVFVMVWTLLLVLIWLSAILTTDTFYLMKELGGKHGKR